MMVDIRVALGDVECLEQRQRRIIRERFRQSTSFSWANSESSSSLITTTVS
jgi:hypothetical protein